MGQPSRHLLTLSAQIVAAHAGNNELEAAALPTMIRSVFNTLSGLDPSPAAPGPTPASGTEDDQVHHHNNHGEQTASHANNGYVHPAYGQTVFGDHLICMECGLSMKMLKRHLLTVHGTTPEDYRAKWDLPESYPMVAREYAKLRSSLALQSGLGLKPDERPAKGRRRGRR